MDRMIALPDLKDGKRYEVVPIMNIVYVESIQDHTSKVVAVRNNDRSEFFESVLSRGIGEVGKKLSGIYFFQRVHNQFLINLKFVQDYNRDEGKICLINGKIIPVSRQKRQLLHKKFLMG